MKCSRASYSRHRQYDHTAWHWSRQDLPIAKPGVAFITAVIISRGASRPAFSIRREVRGAEGRHEQTCSRRLRPASSEALEHSRSGSGRDCRNVRSGNSVSMNVSIASGTRSSRGSEAEHRFHASRSIAKPPQRGVWSPMLWLLMVFLLNDRQYDVPVPRGILARTPKEVADAVTKLGTSYSPQLMGCLHLSD